MLVYLGNKINTPEDYKRWKFNFIFYQKLLSEYMSVILNNSNK